MNSIHYTTSLSDIFWCDVDPLSTLRDIALAMKPELSTEFNITEINGGDAS